MPKKPGLLFILLTYIAGYILLYPLYQYIFDNDGIGYLSVTRRLASGDVANGINGYWSPLHSWLAIPLFKAGMNEFVAFRLLNGLIGAGILIITYRLLRKTHIREQLITITLFICVPIVWSYAFSELAADILLCLVLLMYTDIITEKDFFVNPWKNIACGFIGGISYFAKTYAFPFFLIHFTIVQFLYRSRVQKDNKQFLIRNFLLGITSFLLLAIPWIFILYDKYHFFTIGYAGKLNSVWYNTHHRADTTHLLVELPYPGSSCHWVDPLAFPRVKVENVSLLSVLLEQGRIFLNNIILALKGFHHISFLSTALLLGLWYYTVKKRESFSSLIFTIIVILPAGYLLLFVETRYLWPITFLILVTGVLLVQELLPFLHISKRMQQACWLIFFSSFLIQPVNSLKDMAHADQQVFILARKLQKQSFKGKFVSNTNFSEAQKVAYLTGSQHYEFTRYNFSYEELLATLRNKHIDYFFFYYQNNRDIEAFKYTGLYKAAVQEIAVDRPDLLVLKMQ